MAVNWKVLAAGAVVAIPLVATLATGFGTDPRGVSNALEGREAPVFSMTVLGEDGRKVDLADLRGKPVVLNFWSTWCQPCKLEHPHLVQAAQTWGPQGVSFYGVLFSDDPENAARFLQREGHAFPVLYDPAQRVAIDYGVTGVPETFFIDASGQIVRKVSGPVSFAEISATLEPLL
jgi:cytochrome c biogenesis protein CcmG/thiol:disulfide interchange protein DsbE